MLPDDPELKSRLRALLTRKMLSQQKRYLVPPLNVPQRKTHEGDKISLFREDGSISKLRMRKISVKARIRFDDVKDMTAKDIFKIINEMAEDAALQQSKIAYDEIGKIADEVGNTINLGGKPLTASIFLKMLKKLRIDFDEHGKPILPYIIAGETAADALSTLLPQLEKNPKYRAQYQKLIFAKKEVWRVREASRKLVG